MAYTNENNNEIMIFSFMIIIANMNKKLYDIIMIIHNLLYYEENLHPNMTTIITATN